MGSRLNLMDLAFLALETQRTPVNVASLQIFDLPPSAGDDYFHELLVQLRAHKPGRPFNLKLNSTSFVSMPRWVVDRDLDIEYHVRHSALPKPGSMRDLLELVSRLHSRLMDRERPLWEFHIIEGMADRQFAIYTKMHHAAVDGMGGIALLEACLSPDPQAPMRAPWRGLPDSVKGSPAPDWPNPLKLLKTLRGQISVGTDFSRLLLGQGLKLVGLKPDHSPPPFTAPQTPFNVPISAARKFAIQTVKLSEIKQLARQSGATVNDIVLAICSGALRSYLEAQGKLPEKSLVATVPVSIRQINRSGNQITYVSAQLATQRRNPLARLSEISRSTRHAKMEIADVNPGAAVGFAVMAQGIVALLNRLHVSSVLPPPANVVISNVPGPRRPLYFAGARMRGTFPLSVLVDGQALNITVMSYEDNVDFGLMACREAVPDVERISEGVRQSLEDLKTSIAQMADEGAGEQPVKRRTRSKSAGRKTAGSGAGATRKKTSGKAVGKSAKKSAKKSVGRPAESAAGNSGKKPTSKKAGKKASKKSASKAGKKASKKSASKAATRSASTRKKPTRKAGAAKKASSKKTAGGKSKSGNGATPRKRATAKGKPKPVSNSGRPIRSLREKRAN